MEALYHALQTIWTIVLLFLVFRYSKIKHEEYNLRQKEIETNKELAKQIEDLKRMIDGIVKKE